jgi:lysine biosynthesis protein LysW
MSDNTTKTQVAIAGCPDCGEKIRLQGRIYVGKEVICPDCDAVLEVIDTEPVELDWAFDDEDDEDDDEDW